MDETILRRVSPSIGGPYMWMYRVAKKKRPPHRVAARVLTLTALGLPFLYDSQNY